jgi:uncharacterized membrane protein HdeD (DUF308 family)
MSEILSTLARQSYRSLIWRGVFAVIVGILCFAMPGLSLLLAVALFGAYLFVDGLLLIANGARPEGTAGRAWGMIAFGVFSAIAGVLAYYHPGVALASIVFLIAVRSFVLGGLELGAAFALPRGASRGVIALAGGLSLLLAMMLVTYPVRAAISLLWVFGLYAVLYGASEMYLGFRLQGVTREVFEKPSHPSMPRYSR